jgi:hypothetical protein
VRCKDRDGQIDALLLDGDFDISPGVQNNPIFVRFPACELALDRFAQFEARRIGHQSRSTTIASLRLQSGNPEEEKQNAR